MFSSENKLTSLAELGEFGLIDHLTKNIKIKNPETKKGVGDDAAVLCFGDQQTILTTDLLIEGVHFNLVYTPLKHLGYKAVIANLSDIYAMNAQPKQITVSIALSNKFSLQSVEQLYEGIYTACDKYGVDLVGGDTSTSLTGLTISITAVGVAEAENIVYRNTAQDNDLICVSGDLGAAYMGLQLLEREKKLFLENTGFQPDLEGHDYILERQLKPEARRDVIKMFKEMHLKPTSMIDISDGLSSDILHICHDSNKGCKLFEDKIPIDTQTILMAEEFNISPVTAALSGGEDFELLFTMPLKEYDKIKGLQGITLIGHITDKSEGTSLITSDEQTIALTAQGWNNLSGQNQ